MTRRSKPWIRWPEHGGAPARQPVVAFGGDYNPEQWPAEVWNEDVRLMRQAGVNLVNVGVFSWALIEPRDGEFQFAWLDEVMDLLYRNGIAVDLATGTASPPPWLITKHPEILPVDEQGRTLGFGARQSWCPSSPLYRSYSLRLVEMMAARYGPHPGLAMWHISNELGCHNARCYCAVSAAGFRDWLSKRYRDLDALNMAWGTTFWSQNYTDLQQIQPPRLAPTFPNPTQQLDYARFCSDTLLDQLVAERDIIRRLTPDVPVTTNFMVMGETKNMDYFDWAPHVDLVSNDHYLADETAEPEIELAFSADIARGAAGGQPWMVMEHSTSAVNWGRVNRPKKPLELRRNSLAQVARGADAVSFFQWRASKAGAEKFHSAMLPHAGPNTRVFREVCQLGHDLQGLSEIVGSTVQSDVALLFDWPAWWASELDSHPSQIFSYRGTALAHYRALWKRGVSVDVIPVTTELHRYRLLIVPALYLTDDSTALRVAEFAHAGGSVLVTYFSGIVDVHDHIRLGGYPGAFRDLVGIRVEEFGPLRQTDTITLNDGTTGRIWAEDIETTSAEVVSRFADGPFPGKPAITRRGLPNGGSAWYLATELDARQLIDLLGRVCTEAGVNSLHQAGDSLEATRRTHHDGRSYYFLINHGSDNATITTAGTDLLTGRNYPAGSEIEIAAGDVIVLRQTVDIPTAV